MLGVTCVLYGKQKRFCFLINLGDSNNYLPGFDCVVMNFDMSFQNCLGFYLSILSVVFGHGGSLVFQAAAGPHK